jgi:site-specific recombinase XerD
MATLNYKILPARRKVSGKLGIYLAVTHKKQVRYISTEFEIDDDSQFENGRVCYRKDASIMNKRMAYVLSQYKEKLEGINVKAFSTCAQLKDELMKSHEEESSMTLEELLSNRIDRIRKEGRENYALMNERSKKVIISIIGNPVIEYLTRTDVNLLMTKMKERGYTSGGIHMKLAHLKTAINEAIENRWVKYEHHPFVGVKLPKIGVRLMDVTVEEFQKIRDMELDNKRAMFARDMFLLSFYLGGINLVDLMEADLNGDELCYQRRKTKHRKTGDTFTTFRIPEEARPLIEKHAPKGKLIWPGKKDYALVMSYINACFSILKEKAGIKGTFSYYSGRKTFAQFAFMIGVKTEIIEYCVGQTVKSNRPIYSYVRVMQRQADMAIRKVIDYTTNPDGFDLYDVI